MRFSLPLVSALTAFSRLTHAGSDYHEQLHIRPLPQNALFASFNFRSNSSSSAFGHQNFRYFPRSLGQILQHAHTKELHLRFSLGRWDDESWGARPSGGRREGGTGVEIWAWVDAQNDEEANARWLTLTNTLSGLFCASLNFIDSTKTIRPAVSFEPEGIHPEGAMDNLQLLHGVLPHEVVCTENLTPFLKLLPCKGKAGISSLLDGHKLFDASWQAMALDIRPVCTSQMDCILEIEQTIDMVVDIARSKRPRDNPIPRPIPESELECDMSKSYNGDDTCFPLTKTSESAWSLTEVFGRPIHGSCSITSDDGTSAESVCLNVSPERTVDVRSEGVWSETKYDADTKRCFKLPSNGTDFDISLPEQTLSVHAPTDRPRLYAARSITGYGQERGGVQAVLRNPSATESIEVVYMESLPWYMKPYLHTLRSSMVSLSGPSAADPIKETFYRPALDRHRGCHLELVLTIPPSSTLTLTYDFEKAILRYTEYPPDANRGFDVAAAVVRLLPSKNFPQDVYLRTTTLLLPLPTPDFSMPYNVIILTSTVMALGFGSIFNLLVRRLVAVDEIGPAGLALVALQLQGRIRAAIQKLTSKFGTKSEKKTQ
ncbi:GPI transamidase-like protein component Gpi16 [Venturia nashicola]|uniref:GPI transamidase-like protein component Gpi16 n=1 Tax=Venturia nashicola TaxID=86259 RepID=A0A4Z1NC59_9PEZI|nr:GPI transamidase-like protein component Gpi16 [Venturia nashicola]TLD15019.1 GPI transamidase-like protein component Gpi16 [Venturia nashicola]